MAHTEQAAIPAGTSQAKRMARMVPLGRVSGLRRVADMGALPASPWAAWEDGRMICAGGIIGWERNKWPW